jgi:hypothetical protein
VTGPEALDLLGKVGNPVLLFVVGVVLVAQFASERLSKILGPLGSIGRWWHTREERAEEDLQKLLAARAKTEEQRAVYQLDDMERQLRYFLQVVESQRAEIAGLREELQTAYDLLRDTRTRVGLSTDERLAVRPRPPVPPPPGRHRSVDDDVTTELPRVEG